MPRTIEIGLTLRKVSCLARLLENDAPETCELMWAALPLEGDAWHAKFASNEVYMLVPPVSPQPLSPENTTTMPIPGDIVCSYYAIGQISRYHKEELGITDLPGMVDVAIFYARNNFLFNPAVGIRAVNVWASVVDNLDEMAAACRDVWRSGSVGERMYVRRSTRG